MLVSPDLSTGAGVEGPDPAVPSTEEHHPVDDDRGGLEGIGRRARDQAGAPGLEYPRRAKALDVFRIDLIQRAVPLPVVGAVVGEPVLGLFTGVEKAVVVHAGHHRRRDLSTRDLAAQGALVDSLTRIHVFNGHFLSSFLRPRLGWAVEASLRRNIPQHDDGPGEPPAFVVAGG